MPEDDEEDEGVYHTYRVIIVLDMEATSPAHAAEVGMANLRWDFEEGEGPDMVQVRQFVDTDAPDKVYKVYPNEGYEVQEVYE